MELLSETPIKSSIVLILILNVALPVISEQRVKKQSSHTKCILIDLTDMDRLEASQIFSDENQTQTQSFCDGKKSTRRKSLVNKANEFQVDTTELNVLDDITLKAIMNTTGNISCHWSFKNSRIPCNMKNNTLYSQVTSFTILQIRERHSGVYSLTVKNGNRNWTINFKVVVRAKPKKPKLTMTRMPPMLHCTTENYFVPQLSWRLKCTSSSLIPADKHHESIGSFGVTRLTKLINAINQDIGCCCASNIQGSECSSLHILDLNTTADNRSSVTYVYLKVGDPFLIECRALYRNYKFKIFWKNDTKAGNTTEVLKEQNALSRRDGYRRQEFVFINSVSLKDSGSYTCSSTQHPSKTINLMVFAEGFINSSTVNEVYSIGKDEDFCFEAKLNAFPLIRCQWYFSKTVFPCEPTNLFGNSFSARFCDHGHKPGIYELFAENEEAEFQTSFTLYIKTKPSLTLSMTKTHISCMSTSHPSARLNWTKCTGELCTEGEPVTEGIQTDQSGGEEFGSNITTSVLDTRTMVGGFVMRCCAENVIGSTCKETFLPEQDMKFLQSSFYITAGIFIPSTILLIIFIFYRYKKHPGYEGQLQMIHQIGSSENEYHYVDFSQVSYDVKWEFPRENLELGNVLGSGAFGKVIEATAYGISKVDVPVKVAVKMLKEKCESSEKDALMSELKMMIHMGNHENIVNLLGACTHSGPVYLIFEYCCYGDLLNYLRNNREKFHRTLTDVFTLNNFSFYHNLHNDPQLRYDSGNFLQNGSYIPINRKTGTDTFSHTSEHDLLFSENELTSPSNSAVYQNTNKYEDDDLHVLTFEDLLSFSYQVAKGMEFLTSQSCIHRDLAARNVLVTHGKVAKICDFGLARDIMQDSNYVIRGNARLPVKWMAPESLFEGSYTTRSDVWSYGILLWEIFSLGVNPYPGIQVDSNFYKLIKSGFKMEQPFYATEAIYNVIQSCWALDPGKRLTFSDLVSIFEKHLADAEVALYHNNMECKCNSNYKNLPINSQKSVLNQSASSLNGNILLDQDIKD
ncbi:receptor-type tyrosine-protein kinase FLT3 isoform X1 [Hypanus sabinus]|uniref:receptor-type tyrosine-protein kinase FLT3 isoform X1 n=3 Tax=Hypanus sabinus TaxID=79690 RepID=UPI0028C51018|nr:receptor-type tyrosine-protein kinase FLT3 isoform X1 [Hypanus sabinus]